ncbi:MAG: FimV/HubP family polar landmark protein, partial [Pseudomonadota bacterium]
MVQNKIVRLVNTCLAMWALSPASSWALGVGSLKLDSYLNEPLNAKIELLEATNLSPQEIVVNLAPAAAFEQAGIDRGFTVSQLKFKVQSDAIGKKHIVVLSDNPIREPYVNFLVEVLWPQGRLVREYTVLLDPAEYRDGLPAAVNVPTPTTAEKSTATNSEVATAEEAIFSSKQMPITESKKNEVKPSELKALETKSTVVTTPTPQPTPRAERPTSNTPSALSQPRVSTQTPITQSSQSGSTNNYVVKQNDNLWEIASNLNPSPEYSVHQVMLAIQNVNPDAFIQDNINLVKAGAVLRAPTADQVNAMSRSDAINKVALQNEVWRARLAGRIAQQSTDTDSQQASSKRIDGTDRNLQPEDVKEPTSD